LEDRRDDELAVRSTGPTVPPAVPLHLLVALGVVAGVVEHYVGRAGAWAVGFAVPALGAMIAGGLLGLGFRLAGRKVPALAAALAILLVGRVTALYLDYDNWRTRRTEAIAHLDRMAQAVALQKYGLQGRDMSGVHVVTRSPEQMFEEDLRQLGGRGGFAGYLAMLWRTGLKDRAGKRIAGGWAVVALWALSAAGLAAVCVVLAGEDKFIRQTGSPDRTPDGETPS